MNTEKDNDFSETHLPFTSISSGDGLAILPDLYVLPVQIANIIIIGNPDDSDHFVLVDAGMPHSHKMIIEACEARFGSGCKPKGIILTHGHFDHVGALSALCDHWDVPVFAHKDETPYLDGRKDYLPPDPTVNGGLVTELSHFFPYHGINISRNLHPLPKDGSIPILGNWKWIHTPGHTPGHISLFREADKTLIAGDAFVTVKQESLYKVLVQETEFSGPPKYFTTDWKAAEKSVKKLHSLHPRLAVCGHGLPVYEDELETGLAELTVSFKEIAVPKQGKYIH
ncbi:MBL fold metallo-hydrolase [Falsibacillus pallidus]|uniref:MBL fold metallo-hydrolase n=1 Tax=Falsibacillus pallidus TaxID=493781 RepID=UPI003D99C3B3